MNGVPQKFKNWYKPSFGTLRTNGINRIFDLAVCKERQISCLPNQRCDIRGVLLRCPDRHLLKSTMRPGILFLLVSLAALAGCAEVQFHEKERLNDRIMSFDDDAAGAEMRQHMVTPREGAIGGFSSVGAGGCSCK